MELEYVSHAEKAILNSGGTLSFTNNIFEACLEADVIYAKDWKSLIMSNEEDIAIRTTIKSQ